MLLIALVSLLAPKLLAAEDLLVIALYARLTPAGQVEPTPDAAVESILRGNLRHPLKTFRRSSESPIQSSNRH
jgi:hypothetical protein